MWHDNGYGNVAQRPLATGFSNPCVCTGSSGPDDVDADRSRFTESVFEENINWPQTAGTKIRYNCNLAAEHDGLLAAANFRLYMRGE